MATEKKKGDTYNYKGWLTSDSFWKRAFGVWLYGIAAYVAFVVIAVIIVMILGLLAGFATR